MAKNSGTVIAAVVLCVIFISFVLQIVGFTTPGWMVAEGTIMGQDHESYLGLWYYRLCVLDDCETYTLKEYDDLTSPSGNLQDDMLEADIEVTIALFFCLMAVVSAAIWVWFRYTRRYSRIPVYMCVITCNVSGVLCLVAAGRYGDDVRKTHNAFKDTIGTSPVKAPYALILTGIGGILIIIASFLCYIGMCYSNEMERRQSRRPKYYPPPHEMNQRVDYAPQEKLRPYLHESSRPYQPEPAYPYQPELPRPYYSNSARYSHRETPIMEPMRQSRTSYRHDGPPDGDVIYVKYDPPRGSSHLSASKYQQY